KVDKNTLTHERGKYARLCVQVNLTKPLLGMFTIKGRKYNVEYEGLHMLCLTCGKFGHYKEGCPERGKTTIESHEGGETVKGKASQGHELYDGNIDGPWMVVQKQKRGKKATPARNNTVVDGKNSGGPGRVIAGSKKSTTEPEITGSRFVLLSEEIPVIIEEDMVREETINAEENNEKNIRNVVTVQADNVHANKAKRGNNGMAAKKGDGTQERVSKDFKLATRGGGQFKSKGGASHKKGNDSFLELVGQTIVDQSKREDTLHIFSSTPTIISPPLHF
ncbi:zinc ion binding/nucleic acid binding protein, partial [Trifolium medium]|nr:zinc ion binding/nucleic acid binding protein [Trifolium medium]